MIKFYDKQATIKAGKCTICGKEFDSRLEAIMHKIEHLASYEITDIDCKTLPGGTGINKVFYIRDGSTGEVYEAYAIRSVDIANLTNIQED